MQSDMIEGGLAIGPKESQLRGLNVEINIEADHLEEVLGITFPTKPAKVPLNLSNRLALYRYHRSLSQGNFMEILRGKVKPGTYAWYDDDLGAIFYPTPKENTRDTEFHSNFIKYHENLHSFTHQLNSDLKGANSGLAAELPKIAIGVKVDIPLLERGVVFKAVDEGISNWGAIEVAGTQIGSKPIDTNIPADSYALHRYFLLGLAPPGFEEEAEDERLQKAFQTSLKGLHKSVEPASYRHLTNNFLDGLSNLSEAKEDVMKLVNPTAFIGHFFVAQAMDILRNSGIDRGSGLVMLIKHPPTTFIQLSDPASFAKELLASK